MKYEKYLPLGSIVLLKGGSKKLMITGFCCIGNGKTYDYTGCLYPEGYISADKTLLFNHDQIEKIFVMGYSDDEEKSFKQKLNEVVTEINNNGGFDKFVENAQTSVDNSNADVNIVNGVEQVNLDI